MFMSWIYNLEFNQALGSCIISPAVVSMIYREKEKVGDKLSRGCKSFATVLRKVRQKPLVGFPICASGHWVLLVLRRVGGTNFTVRYYDSASQSEYKELYEIAESILKLL